MSRRQRFFAGSSYPGQLAVALLVLLLGACGGDEGGNGAATGGIDTPVASCAGLAGRTIPGGQVNTATETAAGGVPACVVTGRLEPAVNFQLTIPCDWNGKLLFQGNGGFGGRIPAPETTYSPGVLGNSTCNDSTDGYAVVATDMGHQTSNGFDASWVLSTPAAVDDYGYRAVHVTTLAAHELLKLRFGRDATRSYFEGCSDGGREGLMAAQRYPADFDGIIARAPASNWTGLHSAGNLIAKRLAVPGAKPTTSKLSLLGNAQLAACDALDGLADGIMGLPGNCGAVLEALRCPSGTDAPDCLTDAEIATFQQVRSATPLAFAQTSALASYPGFPAGHEEFPLSWPVWLTEGVPSATPPQLPIKMIAQSAFVRYFIVGDANADPLQVNLANYATALERESRRIDATDPNLGPFFDRGGKLILWHGMADPAISMNNTTAYFEAVRAARGAQADANMRYFAAPGVLHCTFGPGADNVDFVTPMARWVESGSAPENGIVARRFPLGAGGVAQMTQPPILSRPLCRYPQYAHYNGAGDASDAASFSCRTP